jgi:hypothetical protein
MVKERYCVVDVVEKDIVLCVTAERILKTEGVKPLIKHLNEGVKIGHKKLDIANSVSMFSTISTTKYIPA